MKLSVLNKLKENYIATFIVFIYFCGAIFHIIPEARELVLPLTPVVLLFTAIVVLHGFYSHYKKVGLATKFLKWLIFAYIFTLGLEILGTKTGIVFGAYDYGNVLGPMLFDAPLIIGLNWIVVVLGCFVIAKKLVTKLINNYRFEVDIKYHSIISRTSLIVLISLVTAAFTVIFDFILEPVAILLGYWSWETIYVPLQNYAAWFAISFILTAVFISVLKLNPQYTLRSSETKPTSMSKKDNVVRKQENLVLANLLGQTMMLILISLALG